MTIRLLPPEPTKQQLVAKAASGAKGCIAARLQLMQRTHAELRAQVQARNAGD